MPVNQPEAPWPALRRASRTVVVVDVVESVRLMEQDEDDTIRRWQSFVGEVVTRLLPPSGGRLVKSLGDGLMLEFESVPPAIQCALAMQQAIQPYNHGRPSEQWMCLRIGVHAADVVVDERDIYGSGVNLAARLATLAGPGEIVVSAEVRDDLVAGLDADIEDLGDCFLKHLKAPIRAYRVMPGAVPVVSAVSAVPRASAPGSLLPTIAVVPFVNAQAPAESALGDMLADDVMATLAQSDRWNVISRHSSAHFRHREGFVDELRDKLGASYVLSGRYRVVHGRMVLAVELCSATDSHVVWAERMTQATADVLVGESHAHLEIAAQVSRAVIDKEVSRVQCARLRNLDGYSILLGAISWLHSTSIEADNRAQQALEFLADRHPRAPEPGVWMAKACVLRYAQAWSSDHKVEGTKAKALMQRVLDQHPRHAMALAIDGHVAAFLERDYATALERLDAALAINPNEPLAWLYRSSIHSLKDDGEEATRCVEKAKALSPLDPMGYYIDGVAAWAALASRDFARAQAMASRSMRANRKHRPIYATLAIAQMLAGQESEARRTADQIKQLFPPFSVRRYVSGFPADAGGLPDLCQQALTAAGLPP